MTFKQSAGGFISELASDANVSGICAYDARQFR
jgi:hypothetical protein